VPIVVDLPILHHSSAIYSPRPFFPPTLHVPADSTSPSPGASDEHLPAADSEDEEFSDDDHPIPFHTEFSLHFGGLHLLLATVEQAGAVQDHSTGQHAVQGATLSPAAAAALDRVVPVLKGGGKGAATPSPARKLFSPSTATLESASHPLSSKSGATSTPTPSKDNARPSSTAGGDAFADPLVAAALQRLQHVRSAEEAATLQQEISELLASSTVYGAQQAQHEERHPGSSRRILCFAELRIGQLEVHVLVSCWGEWRAP
jgi:hypothetical protein